MFNFKFRCECCGDWKEPSEKTFLETGGFGVTGYVVCKACLNKITDCREGRITYKEVINSKTRLKLMEYLKNLNK